MIWLVKDCQVRVAAGKRKEGGKGGAAGTEFGQVLMEVELEGGWGTAIAWAPSGTHLYHL